jgi:hypothetical protein
VASIAGTRPHDRDDHDQQHAAGHAAEHESFRAQVRERVIGLRSMDRRLRLVVGAAVAQLVVAAIMVALRDLHVPSVIGDVTDGEESSIPVATFVVAVSFLTVSWSFLLAGALHAHWALRVPAFALFFWSFLVEADTVTDRTAGLVAALALMAAIAALTVASIVRDRQRDRHPSATLFLSRLLLLIPLVGGLYLTAWLGSQSTDNTENFTTAVAQQIYNLEYVLIPVLVLAGADFADWGQLLGARAGEALRAARSALPLLLAIVAVAAAMLVDARRVLADDAVRELLLGAVLIAALLLLVWLVRPRGALHAHLPFAALAAVVVIDATIGFLVEQRVHGSDDDVSNHIYATSALVWAALGALCLVLLAVRRGRLSTTALTVTSFVVLVGVCNALFGLDAVGAVFPGLHLSADSTPLDLDGVRAVAGAATLAVVVAVLVSRRLGSARRLLALVLAADVGIQVLAWVDQLFNRTAQVADQVTRGFSIWAAVVLMIALLLEILGSGEAITNRHDRVLPRQSRVLLYLGYVTLVASAVLYFASLHDPASGALRESQFDSESWVHQGVLFLGVPLVLTLFLAGWLRGRSAETAPSD